MLLAEKYVLKDGDTQPEGTVLYKCKYCSRQFAVPKEEADANKIAEVCEQDSCKEMYDKEIAALTASLMKNPTEAQDAINKALGTSNDVKVVNF